jgi:hypothetical protein
VSVQKRPMMRYEIELATDPEFPDCIDRLWAQKQPEYDGWGGYWTICGDNTGSEALVVHPYMIEPLIELLRSLPTEDS